MLSHVFIFAMSTVPANRKKNYCKKTIEVTCSYYEIIVVVAATAAAAVVVVIMMSLPPPLKKT